MTWCFEDKLDQNGDDLALCKELGHDIDSEGLFPIPSNEIKNLKNIVEKTKQDKKNPVAAVRQSAKKSSVRQ